MERLLANLENVIRSYTKKRDISEQVHGICDFLLASKDDLPLEWKERYVAALKDFEKEFFAAAPAYWFTRTLTALA